MVIEFLESLSIPTCFVPQFLDTHDVLKLRSKIRHQEPLSSKFKTDFGEILVSIQELEVFLDEEGRCKVDPNS